MSENFRIDPAYFEPIRDFLLIEQEKVEEATAGGIILPDQQKEREEYAAQSGRIISLGPLAFNEEDPVSGMDERYSGAPEVGDVVLIKKYAGGSYYDGVDGGLYRVLQDIDVLGVIQKADYND
jgi:chaperonin GroES